jgi:hypothetical protein
MPSGKELWERYLSSNGPQWICPGCGAYQLIHPHYYKADGTREGLVAFHFSRKSVFWECRKCKQKWPLEPDSLAPSQAVGVLDVVEVDRVEEPLGNEIRVIDNSASDITVTRTLRATKDWMQSYTVEAEQARLVGHGLEVGSKEIGTFKANAEETLRRKYSFSNEVRQTFAEEIGLTVPARTKIRLTIHWKRIWQRGFVRIQQGPDRLIEVPFQMAVGLTFDQSQVDDH